MRINPLPVPVARRFALGLLALVLALATLPRDPSAPALATAAVALLVVAAAGAALGRERVRPGVRTASALVAIPLIAALRDVTPDGFRHVPLILLPLLWLALRATRGELLAGSALASAVLVGPLVADWTTAQSVTQWRQAELWGVLGPLVALGAHHLDGTAKRRTSELESLMSRLASTERSFRTAFAEAPVAQFMCMPDGTLLRVNDAGCTLVGRTREGLLGAEIAELVADRDHEVLDRILRSTWALEPADAGSTRQVEIELSTGGEPAVHVALSVSLARSDDGRPLYLPGQLADVTARRAAARRHEVVVRTQSTLQAMTSRLAPGADPRWHVCEAARALSAGAFAALVEPTADGLLVSTARAGAAAPAAKGSWSQGSPAAVAFRTGRPVLATFAAEQTGADERRLAAAGIRAALFEPIVRDDGPFGVLAVGWAPPTGTVDDEAEEAIRLLAAERGALFTRADELRDLVDRANRDALTGLPNRRLWEEQLPRDIAQAQADARPLCVAIIDLDHFKAYNDEHGHPAGDRLLAGAAAAWRARLRRGDMLARYGGEEFAVVLPGCDTDQALELLERVRAATPSPCTCSIGLVKWDGRESREALIERADRALYVAKRNGRDRTHVSQPRRTPLALLEGDASPELDTQRAC